MKNIIQNISAVAWPGKLAFTVALLAAVFLVSGCHTTGEHITWYAGPPRPTNEVSLVNFQRDKRSDRHVLIHRVDGTELDDRPDYNNSKRIGTINNTKEMELLPGVHTLEMAYIHADEYSIKDIALGFKSEAGHVYDVYAARIVGDKDHPPKMGFFDTRIYLAAWVVDEQTDSVVAGERYTKYYLLKNELTGMGGRVIQHGRQIVTDSFTLQASLIYNLELEVDDPIKKLTTQDVAFKWYAGSKLVSASSDGQYTVVFDGISNRLRTEIPASTFGLGHFRVEMLVYGDVVATRSFDIVP